MKAITLFLLIFSTYALTSNSTIQDIFSSRFRHFYDEETDSYNFYNMNNDHSDYVWEGVNEEGIIPSVVEWPLEENHVGSRKKILYDSSEVNLLNVLSQILKSSLRHHEISSLLENNLKSNEKDPYMSFKTKEGYIDLFDLLIFGSLRSKRLYGNTFGEEESNEEGIFHTVMHNDVELTTMEEEDYDFDEDEDDIDFLELITSNKHFNGEYIIEMVLSMMKRHSNDVDDEEEENLFVKKEQNLAPQKALETGVYEDTKENPLKFQDTKYMRPTENKERSELDHVFASVFGF